MAGLYVHIPFCVQKCRYCDFISFPGDRVQIAAYLYALEKEIALCAQDTVFASQTYSTLFIGGGTPSLLSADQMERLLRCLKKHFLIAPDGEITVEINPGTVDAQKLIAYRAVGINRLSMGMQSACDELLRSIGRIHTLQDAKNALCWIKEAGFENYNLDVMYGLPGQKIRDYLDALALAVESGCTHVSAYSLILEEGTPLYDDVMAGRRLLPDEDVVADMEQQGSAFLQQAGFVRYEVSNFARPGWESRHNRNYWQNGTYLGLGLAAHSAYRRDGAWMRRSNVESFCAYQTALEKGCLPVADEVQIPPKEEMFESLMLGLRMVQGLDIAAFGRRFGQSPLKVYQTQIAAAQAAGHMQVAEGFLRLTPRGMDIQNSVLLPFLED